MKPQVSIGKMPQFSNLTNQQGRAVISHSSSVMVNAFAGTGKTSGVMLPYAAARPRARGLYLVFGKENQIKANAQLRRLQVNTEASTTHALAFPTYGNAMQKAGKLKSGLKPAITSELLGCNFAVAAAVNEAINNFTASKSVSIDESHLPSAEKRKIMETQSDVVMDGARRLWSRMIDLTDGAPATHDTYLKQWALTKPVLEYHFILGDEWQDSNPLTIDLIGRQEHASRVYVGDRHQSIYGFRGAVNAMDEVKVEDMHFLTNSFRFTPSIGVLASTFLAHWKNEKNKIVGCAKPWDVNNAADVAERRGAQIAYLGRTVAGLIAKGFELHSKGAKISWVKGFDNYRSNSIIEAHKLFSGKLSDITDPTLKMMPSWLALEEYVESSGDGEAGALFKLVSKYKNEIPGMVNSLRESQVTSSDPAAARYVLTTAHQAKGLEWPMVRLCGDFFSFRDREGQWMNPKGMDSQEINLMYVCLTRAMKGISPNVEIDNWFRHQEATKHLMPPRDDQESNAQSRVVDNNSNTGPSSSAPRAA